MKRIVLTCCMIVFLLMAVQASADIITFNLTVPNTGLSVDPAPYASIQINRTSPTIADVTFTGLQTSPNTYFFGDSSAVALNVNAGSFTVGSIAGTNSYAGFAPGPFTNSGAGNVSSFGVFNLTINNFDGWGNAAGSVTFTLTDTSGTWASASNVLAPNDGGSTAAAHIFVGDLMPTVADGALLTGYAANGAPVPEPSTLLLLGTGIVTTAGIARRRFRKS